MSGKIVLIGGGGHCRSVIDAAKAMQSFSEIVITDPGIEVGTELDGCRVVGDDNELPELYEKGIAQALITVGSLDNTDIRRRVKEKASDCGFSFVSVIDPTATVSVSSEIGYGVFVGKGSVINAGAIVEDHVIINTGAIIEHDCKIGAFSHIAVGAILCGGVEVGEDVLVGAGATVVQGVKIGRGSVIGAGAVVRGEIPAYCLAVGVPAKVVKKHAAE